MFTLEFAFRTSTNTHPDNQVTNWEKKTKTIIVSFKCLMSVIEK